LHEVQHQVVRIIATLAVSDRYLQRTPFVADPAEIDILGDELLIGIA